MGIKCLPGGWTERVYIMKARDAERAVLRASQPGPKNEKANTPIAAQPIWAINILYFCKFWFQKRNCVWVFSPFYFFWKKSKVYKYYKDRMRLWFHLNNIYKLLISKEIDIKLY